MGAAPGRHDLHALLHFFNRDAVDGCRTLYEFLNKLDTLINSVRLEAFKIQRTPGKML